MSKLLLLTAMLFTAQLTFSQNLDHLDSYTVDQFYKKLDLDYGTLDESGYSIDYIFVKTDPDLDSGLYEIEITDGPGDLYEIKGTSLYVKFRGYYGYAGYGEECILEVTSSYYGSAIVYKLE